MKHAKGDLTKINNLLNENFGSYEAAFFRMGGDFDLGSLSLAWPNLVKMTVATEAAALGLVQNPVLPELQASAIAVGYMRGAFQGRPRADTYVELAGLAGGGIERRLNAVSTDLIQSVPFQKQNVLMFGIDAKAQKAWRIRQASLMATAQTRETFYNGLKGQVSVALDRKLRNTTHDWLLKGDLGYSFWNLHGLFGVHPLPSDFLPRVWDRVANTYSWRELGAMAGGGMGATWALGAHSKLKVLGGFYSGYLGGELRLLAGRNSEFRLSSYKIENSSAYHAFGRRIYAFHGYLAF